MNDIQVFQNAELGSIRTVVMGGEPYFVGKDVADILGYSNSRKALADHVDDEDKGVTKCDTLGGNQELTVINESGLYCLILSSKLSKAKAFKRWVTHDVIPAIRKHGVYAVDEVLNDPDLLISALTALKEERQQRQKLELEAAISRQQIAEMHPKVSYYDKVLACPDLVKISLIAKDYGMSAIAFNRLLHKKGIQFKQGDTWLLYQEYADKGYTNSKTYTYEDGNGMEHSKLHTLWTQSGRLFLYHILKEDGILPMIERA